jgi:hypothetical protein
MTTILVTVYLAAIVAANWIVSVWGPAASILTAFVLIGLIVTTRDRLHDAWGGHLKRNMGLLILGGSGISLLLGGGVTRIALASGAAFLVSESVDAALYHFLRKRGWYERVNGSNAASSLVDSVLFPWLAFGGLMPLITLGQWGAKTFGGAIWSWMLRPRQLATLTLLALAAPASSQVSVGLGEYHNKVVTQTVIESVIMFPSVAGIRPNAIVSWDLRGDGKPVVLPQLGKDIALSNFPVIVGVDIGASAGPWDDYGHWEPHVSARVIAFISGPWKALTIMSWQPWNEWGRAVVVKLDYTLW